MDISDSKYRALCIVLFLLFCLFVCLFFVVVFLPVTQKVILIFSIVLGAEGNSCWTARIFPTILRFQAPLGSSMRYLPIYSIATFTSKAFV